MSLSLLPSCEKHPSLTLSMQCPAGAMGQSGRQGVLEGMKLSLTPFAFFHSRDSMENLQELLLCQHQGEGEQKWHL